MRIGDWSSDVCSSDLFYPWRRVFGDYRNAAPNGRTDKGCCMTIRTILVDDESLAIQGLKLRLEAHEDVEIVDTCLNGREAIRSIKTHKPDLVFLDIQMPGFDGFRSEEHTSELQSLMRSTY